MDRNKALDKIKKCLRLASSSNPHEAAAALRQARALMEKYQVTDGDVLMADVQETTVRSGSKVNPPKWEVQLSVTVAWAYNCGIVFLVGPGQWAFIGEMSEVASYAMTVLLRQVRQHRRDYMADKLKRCKAATKTKRADVFCEAWVRGVRRAVAEFAGTNKPSAAVLAYMGKHYPDLDKLNPLDRNASTNKLSARALNDAANGIEAANGVQLNHGVNGEAPRTLH
ncbi:DUF2786 domain-containing protein [Pseudomonas sichuanensis]|uniref:DUF2786 domain-containing protein n=1 Tax=Pseudomonas sichuanensis TaxID=2213015 RepID=UPI000DA696D4|nr:DUF2786 domain-containing protein [Pseudomonas sichuanensis]